jgi:hypothetical protein
LKPSIGRIVIYNHPGSAGGKYPPTQSPAIIQNVAPDGTVRLFVFGPKGQHMDEGLTQGDGPCQWNWPPRIEEKGSQRPGPSTAASTEQTKISQGGK